MQETDVDELQHYFAYFHKAPKQTESPERTPAKLSSVNTQRKMLYYSEDPTKMMDISEEQIQVEVEKLFEI